MYSWVPDVVACRQEHLIERCDHTYREFADVPVMQIGYRVVDILRAEAAHIRSSARVETSVAVDGEFDLEAYVTS